MNKYTTQELQLLKQAIEELQEKDLNNNYDYQKIIFKLSRDLIETMEELQGLSKAKEQVAKIAREGKA
jgi:hypothetical protein|tara:strand:+ start:1804 stop:2007 length:204 start_codon:yes stop_codon:yes gene_type:complete